MSRRHDIVQRSDNVKDIDKLVKNKWSWKWMEAEVDNVLLDVFIRKLTEDGKALCLWCNCEIKYSSSGCKALKDHARTEKHKQHLKTRQSNYRLPCKFFDSQMYSVIFIIIMYYKSNTFLSVKFNCLSLMVRLFNIESALLVILCKWSS